MAKLQLIVSVRAGHAVEVFFTSKRRASQHASLKACVQHYAKGAVLSAITDDSSLRAWIGGGMPILETGVIIRLYKNQYPDRAVELQAPPVEAPKAKRVRKPTKKQLAKQAAAEEAGNPLFN